MRTAAPRSDLLEWYVAGSCTAAWDALIHAGPTHPQAAAIAAEVMRRLLDDIELVSMRLEEAGFPVVGRQPLAEEELAVLPQLERLVGPLPLALRALWEQLGTLCLQHRGFWLHQQQVEAQWLPLLEADPLWVDGPSAVLGAAVRWATPPAGKRGPLHVPLSPDRKQKARRPAERPCEILLGRAVVDPHVLGVPDSSRLVDHLRGALLTWGGFPGLADLEEWQPFVLSLTEGLEPF